MIIIKKDAAKSTLGGFSTIDEFVNAKLKRLANTEHNFATLFELMFSEKGNTMYERTYGYRIEKATYGEVYDRILKRTGAMKKALKEASQNAVVGIYMQNSVEWIEIFWTVLRCGFCPLLLNSRLDEATLEDALKRSGAVAVVSDGKAFSLPAFAPEDIMDDSEAGTERFGERIIVMSSGTSSHVKLCSYTAKEFYFQIQDSFEIIKKNPDVKKHYEGELKLLTFLPFYHIFGLVAVYIWFAFFSRTFVHLADMAPQTILGTIRRHKVTHIFAVPLFWEKVYDEVIRTIRGRGEELYAKFQKGLKIAEKIVDIPVLGELFAKKAFKEVRENLFGESVSFMITGGSGISPEVLWLFNAIGYPLANGYGMTEIGITSVELSRKCTVRGAGFVGMPLSSVEYSISESGELLVRGKGLAASVMEGEETKYRSDEWFRTGDLAEEVGGRYRILGRLDDVIIGTSGENLNPNIIEPKFNVPEVKQVCLVKGAGGGAVLLASVGGHLSAEAIGNIEKAIKDRAAELGLSQELQKIALIEGELMTEQEFKLNRKRLSKDYAAGALKEVKPYVPTAQAPEDPLYNRILELFGAALGKDTAEITPEMNFFIDCGGSSLDYFVLLGALRDEFGLETSDAEGLNLHTPAALYKHFKDGE